MPFVQAKCPECGGMLPVDDSKKATVCQFCGEAFIVQEAINNYNIPDVPEIPLDYMPLEIPEIPEEYLNLDVPKIPDNMIAQTDYVPRNDNSSNEDYGEVYDVKCPCCGALFLLSDKALNKGTIVCPFCKESLELNIEYDEEDYNINNTSDNTLEQVDFVPNNETSSNAPSSNNKVLNLNSKDFIIEDGILKKYRGTDENVVVPDGVRIIWEAAFKDCKNIKSVSLPNTLFRFLAYAFENCENLESVTLPNSLTDMGYSTFYKCKNLMSVSIPHSVTRIGASDFWKCTNLKSITIPDSVTTIGDRAFFDCESLESITIPDSVTTIEEMAFAGCSTLKSITIPDSVTTIGYGAFCGCENLTSVTMPPKIENLDTGVFKNCPRLKYIKNPKSIIPKSKKYYRTF